MKTRPSTQRTYLRCIALGLPILIVLSTGCVENDEGRNTEGWVDLSDIIRDIRDDLPQNFRYLSNTSNAGNIPDPGNTMLFLIGVESDITAAQRITLVEYVEKGGTLIFASDRIDKTSELADRFGIFYYEHKLVDSNYEFNSSFIVGTSGYLGFEMDIMFNDPKGLNLTGTNDDGMKIERVAASSAITFRDRRILSQSYVDKNDNGEHDIWDVDGPIALGYRVEKGMGAAYVFGDVGPFLNDIYYRKDNKAFVRGLIDKEIPDDGTIYFDVDHHISDSSGHIVFPK